MKSDCHSVLTKLVGTCFLISWLLFIQACSSGSGQDNSRPEVGQLDSANLRHARHFRLLQKEDLTQLQVNIGADQAAGKHASKEENWLKWTLVPRSSLSSYKAAAGERVIPIPVQRVVCTSTTHAALFSILEAREVIVGMAWPDNLSDSLLRERASQGSITDVSRELDLNHEVVLGLNPDAVITFVGSDPGYGDFDKLMDLGLPVIANVEYLEAHPLGQAEWIRFAGALLGRDQEAEEIFSGIESRYMQLRDSIARVLQSGRDRPTVFTGLDWKGVWTVPRGESFAARYLFDAGASYLWAETPGYGNLPLDFEGVFERAADARIWLHPGAARSLDELAARDPRLTNFSAWKEGRVWNRNAAELPNGANDYWERGIVRPDLVLEDLIQVLHAERPADTLNFYKRVP